MEMDTGDAASHVPNEYLDFVFIDADHSTHAVLRDISFWRPKLKPTGFLLGHDANWPSVSRALTAILGTWTELDANVWCKPVHPDARLKG